MRRCLRLCALAVIGLATCGLLSGCSFSYTFEVSGVIRDAMDGKPVVGARIYSLHDNLQGTPNPDSKPVAVTEGDGSFSFVESISDISFEIDHSAKWVLFISNDGFEDKRCDLRKVKRTQSAKEPGEVYLELLISERKPR